MAKQIEIERLDESQLHMQKWVFWYDERYHRLLLDEYTTLGRDTRRHKFVTTAGYFRLSERAATISRGDVPLPWDVKEAARQKFLDGLAVDI